MFSYPSMVLDEGDGAVRAHKVIPTFLFMLCGASALAAPEDRFGMDMPTISPGNARGSQPLSHEFGGADIVGISGRTIYNTLKTVSDNTQLVFRGAVEANIFSKLSPSVVIIITDDGMGSGSLISKSGTILTNWHVVNESSEVDVIFKPAGQEEPKESDVLVGKVMFVDEISDLALVTVQSVPRNSKPIPLANHSDIHVGADVHAIGHPEGLLWTYTKGLISQVRPGFQWGSGDKIVHEADIIQTQTPINFGNSGGPLLSNNGKLVGVNSMGREGEGLNFAIAVSEVKRFIAAKESRLAPDKPGKTDEQGKKTSDWCWLNEEAGDDAKIVPVDFDCDEKVDGVFIVPHDKSEPISCVFDRNDDGKHDQIIYDTDRDGSWDVSLWDVDFDGDSDLRGYHPDGKFKPSRYEGIS